jgi:Domain of unknown function (DUF4326)
MRAKIEDCALREGAVYIGRFQHCGKRTFHASVWGNPFAVKRYGREGVVRKYRERLLRRADPIRQGFLCRVSEVGSPMYIRL